MAKVSGSTMLLGAAGVAGGLYLYAKSKGLLPASVDTAIAPILTISPTIAPVTPVDTQSAAYLTAVANATQAALNNNPNGCVSTPYGPVCPSNFNNPTLQPAVQINPPVTTTPVTTPVITAPTPPLVMNDDDGNWIKTCYLGKIWRKRPGSYELYGEETSQYCQPNNPAAGGPSSSFSVSATPVTYVEYCENGMISRRPQGSPGHTCAGQDIP